MTEWTHSSKQVGSEHEAVGVRTQPEDSLSFSIWSATCSLGHNPQTDRVVYKPILLLLLTVSEWRLIKRVTHKHQVMPIYASTRLRTRNARIALKRKTNRWFTTRFCFNYIREFFLHTSQHGYKHIAQPKVTAIERWVITKVKKKCLSPSPPLPPSFSQLPLCSCSPSSYSSPTSTYLHLPYLSSPPPPTSRFQSPTT
jgi:hypothetical protein